MCIYLGSFYNSWLLEGLSSQYSLLIAAFSLPHHLTFFHDFSFLLYIIVFYFHCLVNLPHHPLLVFWLLSLFQEKYTCLKTWVTDLVLVPRVRILCNTLNSEMRSFKGKCRKENDQVDKILGEISHIFYSVSYLFTLK